MTAGSMGKRSPVLGFLVLFFFANFFPAFVLADRVLSASTGVTFGRSSREPKYKIEFHSVESPFHADNSLETMTMSSNEGKNYLCFLPTVEETKISKPVAQHNTSNIVVGTDRGIKLKTPDELLKVIKDMGCLYRHEGWWSYEFCYHDKFRQLHLEEEKIAQEFVLGVFDPEATSAFNQNNSDTSTLKDPRSKDASQRYHAHIFTNGTICDLTNQPRETEVRFVCSESAVMISSFKEISTCKYAVTIQCPMLCKHPMFQQERPTWHTIHCNELPPKEKETEMDNHKSNEISFITDDTERFAT